MEVVFDMEPDAWDEDKRNIFKRTILEALLVYLVGDEVKEDGNLAKVEIVEITAGKDDDNHIVLGTSTVHWRLMNVGYGLMRESAYRIVRAAVDPNYAEASEVQLCCLYKDTPAEESVTPNPTYLRTKLALSNLPLTGTASFAADAAANTCRFCTATDSGFACDYTTGGNTITATAGAWDDLAASANCDFANYASQWL